MTRSLLKQEAKKLLSKNLGTLILASLLLGIVMIPVRILGSNIGTALAKIIYDNQPLMATSLITPINIILFCLTLPILLTLPTMIVGVNHIYLKAANDEKTHFSDIFSKFSLFGKALLADILMAIFLSLQFLLLIVPGIIAYYSYSMTYFIMAEHPELSAMEAIKESKKIMKGHRFELFVLELSFILWYLLELITLRLASIYVTPYKTMAKTVFYNKIKNGVEM